MSDGATANPGKLDQSTAGRALAIMVEIALEKGLDALSMREVAKRAGISLAALQYHYRNKDALLSSFVASRLEDYRRSIVALIREADPGTELRSLIRFAVEQTLEDRTMAIFAMLGARSRHDLMTAEAMDRFMRFYVETLSEVVSLGHPTLSRHERALAAVQIAAMLEGVSSVVHASEALGIKGSELREAIVDAALALLPAS